MRKAFHIFAKDLRHLWPAILVLLIICAAHAYFDLLRFPIDSPEVVRTNMIAGILKFLLVVAWFYLIACAVYEERLPGDTQFWVTRPYSWPSLLGSKLLLVLAFFNVPLFLSDCILLWRNGLPLILPALLQRQVSLTLMIALPALLLASVTSGFGHLVLLFLICILALVAESVLLTPAHTGVGGMHVAVPEWEILIGLAIAVIVWQFATRRTWIAIAVFGSYVFVIGQAIEAIPRHRTMVQYEDYRPEIGQRFNPGNLNIAISTGPVFDCNLSLAVEGLPPNVMLVGRAEVRSAQLSTRTGEHRYGLIRKRGAQYCLDIPLISQDSSNPHRPGPLQAELWLTAEQDTFLRRFPVSQGHFALPDSGYCDDRLAALARVVDLTCTEGPYALNNTIAQLEVPGSGRDQALEAELFGNHELLRGLSPVSKIAVRFGPLGRVQMSPSNASALDAAGAEIAFYRRDPIGYGRKLIQAENVDLAASAAR